MTLEASAAAGRVLPQAGATHHFDGVHTGSSNADVYASVARPLVQSCLQGYDAVVFAYGQTASGKTFTLSGDDRSGEAGIISRAVWDLFHGIRQGSARREYLLRVSYLEIWNELVRDLLEPKNSPQVRDDRRRGTHGVLVAPLQEQVVTSPSQIHAVLKRGEANRHIGATDWNERSSRSHTCFKIIVESWERDTDARANARVAKHYRVSELSLIDLAGSERHSQHASSRRTEGANINKSLLSLGKVIYALSERSAAGPSTRTIHVPYRDSKLTRILQNSLSGRARAAVVCTLNPSAAAVEESLSTLHFARRIKTVAVRARRNEYEGDISLVDGGGAAPPEAQALLVRYREEMGALRAKVATLQRSQTPVDTREEPRSSSDDIVALQARLDQLSALIVRGGEDNSSDTEPHPVSPAKQRGFSFEDPADIAQTKLHAALNKISRLERKLATRMSLPADAHPEKDARIERLQEQVRELETVCEAQMLDAPQQVREDVEREFGARLEEARQHMQERDAFIAELRAECERLRTANKRLVALAHQQTTDMVSSLREKENAPRMMSLFAPHFRSATALGRAPFPPTPSTPSPSRQRAACVPGSAPPAPRMSIDMSDASDDASDSDLLDGPMPGETSED